MRMLVDIGNTRLKWVIEESGQFLEQGSFLNQELANQSAYAEQIPIASLDSVWVSCVGPEHVFNDFRDWCRKKFAVSVNRVKVTEAAAGIKNAYAELTQLGVDRWVAAIGGRQVVKKGPVIIIDAGTAVTVDILSGDNVYLGGAILPGLMLMHDSLVQRTEGIKSQVSHWPKVVGSNTKECVNSGVHYGFVGAVDRVVSTILQEHSRKITLVVTGGDAELLKKYSDHSLILNQHLVHQGLVALAQETL